MKRTFAIVLAALAAAALFRALVYAVLVAAHVSEPSRHHGLRPDAPATLGHRGRCGGTGRRGHWWAGLVVPYRILPAAVQAVKQVATSRLKLFNNLA